MSGTPCVDRGVEHIPSSSSVERNDPASRMMVDKAYRERGFKNREYYNINEGCVVAKEVFTTTGWVEFYIRCNEKERINIVKRGRKEKGLVVAPVWKKNMAPTT